MRIAIDLRPLQIGHQNRGIGAYILNLLQNTPYDANTTYIFLRYDTSNPITDYGIGEGRNYVEVTYKKHTYSRHPMRLMSYVIASLMPSYMKLWRHRPDVFFQSDYLLGGPRIFGCKLVTVSYDLIPFKFRSFYLPRWRKYVGYRQLRLRSRLRLIFHAWFYERKYQLGVRLLRRSDKVISISKNTTHDLVTMLGLKERKIATIYLAASFRNQQEDMVVRPEIKDLVDSQKQPYLAYIGATDRRRQVEELVHGFNLYNAHQKPIGLLLGGNEFRLTSKSLSKRARYAIENSSYNAHIHLLGRITEAEKHYILEHASVFVYPTLYEGFGLPILEAMTAGCTVLTYKNSSIPEIAGDAAYYTADEGGYAIYQALTKLLGDEHLLSQLTERGKQRAKDFDWAKTAQQVWGEVYKLVK